MGTVFRGLTRQFRCNPSQGAMFCNCEKLTKNRSEYDFRTAFRTRRASLRKKNAEIERPPTGGKSDFSRRRICFQNSAQVFCDQHRVKCRFPRAKEGAVGRTVGFVVLVLTLGACVNSPAQQPSAEQRTATYLVSVRQHPSLLLEFLREMPKGGDLHNHLAGTIYTES